MKKMHRQMKNQKKFCKDESGRKRKDQESWKIDDCKTCMCKVCNLCYLFIKKLNSVEVQVFELRLN
jgi:hypothetical protein